MMVAALFFQQIAGFDILGCYRCDQRQGGERSEREEASNTGMEKHGSPPADILPKMFLTVNGIHDLPNLRH
jgi:hypothetical protein